MAFRILKLFLTFIPLTVAVVTIHSCVSAPTAQLCRAGYGWSSLYGDTVFLFEKSIPLTSPDWLTSAGIVFSADSAQVEFIPFVGRSELFTLSSDSSRWEGDGKEIVFDNGLWSVQNDSGRMLYMQPITESLRSLGALVVETYEGVLADITGDSAHYVLTVRHQAHSGDGCFQLLRIHHGIGMSEDSVSTSYGIVYTHRGMTGDNDATVWQCRVKSGMEYNFLRRDSHTLTLLDNDMNIVDTLASNNLKLVRK